jgi:hypothetical protein
MAGTARRRRPERDADRDAQAARLRALRFTYEDIAEQLGYADHTGAMRAAQRGRKASVREPHEDMVLMDLAELDEMAREAWQVLRRPHLVVSQGRVAKHPYTDEPLHDDGPILAAIGKLLDIQARRAKLVGSDAPTKSSVQVITKDAFTEDLERMAAELESND